ncbi:hypothetical protein WDW37_01195 [Bdellovibrionota bacterium FG-1]
MKIGIRGLMKGLALAITTVAVATGVTAGERIGNGGVGVVCRNPQGRIVGTPEMLDVFEAGNQYHLNFDKSPGISVDMRVNLAQLQMTSNQKFLSDFQTELARVRSKITFLNRGIGLEPTNDAFPVINKRGCKFEQVANYSNDGNIYVDKEIFDRLDGVNQAALYVHETVYAIARHEVGETSSIRSRRLTGQVLANNSDSGVIRELMAQLSTPPAPVAPPKPQRPIDKIVNGATYVDMGQEYCALHIEKNANTELVITFIGDPRGNRQCSGAGETWIYVCTEKGVCRSLGGILQGMQSFVDGSHDLTGWRKVMEFKIIDDGSLLQRSFYMKDEREIEVTSWEKYIYY